MLKAVEFFKFAEKSGWIVVEKKEEINYDYICYLIPAGKIVKVEFNNRDGSIWRIHS